MNILNKKNKGLTLIETLIAITILLMSTVMPMVIYSNSITNSLFAGEQITATYLAQEALELVKYDIYTEFNNNSGWFGLPNCNGQGIGNRCTIDIPNGNVCRGSNCNTNLYIDSTTNLYTHFSGVSNKLTKFSRTIKFENNPSVSVAPVSATVKWMNGGKVKSVTIKEYLTKWR